MKGFWVKAFFCVSLISTCILAGCAGKAADMSNDVRTSTVSDGSENAGG